MEKTPKSSLPSVDNRSKSGSRHQDKDTRVHQRTVEWKNRREGQFIQNRNLDPKGAKEEFNPRKTLSKDDTKGRKAKGKNKSTEKLPSFTVKREGVRADSKKLNVTGGIFPEEGREKRVKKKKGKEKAVKTTDGISDSSDVSTTNITKMKAKKRNAVQVKSADKMHPGQNDMEKSKKKKALKTKFPVGKSESSTSTKQTSMGKESTAVQGVSKENLLKTPTTVTFVTFDLETTGLIRGSVVPHITQIGAYVLNSKEDFSEYVIPKKPLSLSAAKLTNILMTGPNQMSVKGRPVPALNIRVAFDKFMQWLGRFPNPVLIAHYGRKFDFVVFRSAIKNINKTEKLDRRVCQYIDSIDVFRKTYPYSRSYKQEDLAASLLNITYEAHNASRDARVLAQLMEHTNLSRQHLLQYSFPPNVCDFY